jgi:hypothetical protein
MMKDNIQGLRSLARVHPGYAGMIALTDLHLQRGLVLKGDFEDFSRMRQN